MYRYLNKLKQAICSQHGTGRQGGQCILSQLQAPTASYTHSVALYCMDTTSTHAIPCISSKLTATGYSLPGLQTNSLSNRTSMICRCNNSVTLLITDSSHSYGITAAKAGTQQMVQKKCSELVGPTVVYE